MTLSFQELAIAMIKCEQTKGQTVYQHGVSVKNHFEELRDALDRGISPEGWRIPSWVVDYREAILDNLHDEEIVTAYTIYHDCGKNKCKIIDEQNKIHYPNHATVSKELFLEAGGNVLAANLIGWDMCLHTCSSEEIQNYCENVWSIRDACTLLLVALAELHSNARLFGGIDSVSFKSKWKTIDRRGRQICKFLFTKEGVK